MGFVAKKQETEIYHVLYKKIEDDKLSIAHFFRQFTFMKSKRRDELKWFSQERGTLRHPESKTRLIDFTKVHTQLFGYL